MKLPSIKKTVVIAVLSVVGVTVICGVWCLYCGVTVSLEAEKTLHVYSMVLDLVSEHVKRTSGQWPRSWDDLRQTSPSQEWPRKWPDDIEEIKRRIRIDFSVTCTEVSKQSANNFHAIEQIGPQYAPYEGHIISLLDTCREYSEPRKKPR